MLSHYVADVVLMDMDTVVKTSESIPEFLEFLDKKDLQFDVPRLESLMFNIGMDNRVIYLSSDSDDAENRKGAFRFAIPAFSKIYNKWKVIRTTVISP